MSNPQKPKTVALTMPADPLSILSMQNLDQHFALAHTPPAPEPQVDPDSQPRSDILTSSNQDSKTDSNQYNNQDDKIASQPESKLDRQQERKLDSQPDARSARKKASLSPVDPRPADPRPADPRPVDPLDQALLQKLTQVYPELSRERSTLVSSRLPDDIVERLGYAADLVKKHRKSKQDVITRGLILAFEELVKNDGAVEWYEK